MLAVHRPLFRLQITKLAWKSQNLSCLVSWAWKCEYAIIRAELSITIIWIWIGDDLGYWRIHVCASLSVSELNQITATICRYHLRQSDLQMSCGTWLPVHYNDVIIGAIASQITSLTIVYPIVYSDADQRKHRSSASLAFERGTGEVPAQMASYAENVSIWWRRHDISL